VQGQQRDPFWRQNGRTAFAPFVLFRNEVIFGLIQEGDCRGKEGGKLDKRSSDPILVTLFRLILKWALISNNIFLWVWLILQWHFMMARSISIDPLSLHNFRVGEVCIIGFYDKSKANQEG
jgi:hypothetical protein